MDLVDEADINFNINDENMIQKEGKIGDKELLDVDNAQQNVENNSENRHYNETNFLWKLMKIL